MSLVQLTYVSVATRPMSRDDLVQILKEARDHNSQHDVTGMLLFRDSYFIQALEGEETVIRDLFERIAKDSRHDHVLEIGSDPIQKRDFMEWSMGFNEIAEDDVNLSLIPGYSDYMASDGDFGEFVQEQSRAITLLRLFRSRSNF
ncbi:MAG: BLUF domain-containing protein [Chloroflexota bacterium]